MESMPLSKTIVIPEMPMVDTMIPTTSPDKNRTINASLALFNICSLTNDQLLVNRFLASQEYWDVQNQHGVWF